MSADVCKLSRDISPASLQLPEPHGKGLAHLQTGWHGHQYSKWHSLMECSAVHRTSPSADPGAGGALVSNSSGIKLCLPGPTASPECSSTAARSGSHWSTGDDTASGVPLPPSLGCPQRVIAVVDDHIVASECTPVLHKLGCMGEPR